MTSLARFAIYTILKHFGNVDPRYRTDAPKGSAMLFVTVYYDDVLMGCVGNMQINPIRKQIEDLAVSACSDHRFNNQDLRERLRADPAGVIKESHTLRVEVSVLGPLNKMNDLLDFQIGRDGLYLILFDSVNGLYTPSSVYLPEVAHEHGWTKQETIAELIIKTGVKSSDLIIQDGGTCQQTPQQYPRPCRYSIGAIYKFITTKSIATAII